MDNIRLYLIPKSSKQDSKIGIKIYPSINNKLKMIMFGFVDILNKIPNEDDIDPKSKICLPLDILMLSPQEISNNKKKHDEQLSSKSIKSIKSVKSMETYFELYEIAKIFYPYFSKKGKNILFTANKFDDIIQNIFTSMKISNVKITNKNSDGDIIFLFIDNFMTDIDNLKKFISNKEGSSLIIECSLLYDIRDINILNYLMNNFEFTYIYKPLSSSPLNNKYYIVMINLLPSMIIDVDKLNKPITETSVEIYNHIKCINSKIIGDTISTYGKIKNYIDSQNYFGYFYDSQIERQKNNANIWIDTFIKKDNDSFNEYFKKFTNQICQY